MTIKPGEVGFDFTEAVIKSNTPNASGVYALYRENQWIYFGETNEIQRRLLEHLNEKDTLIKHYGPSFFLFELWPENQRVVRQNQLILAFPTPCNRRLG
jgi:hypothetical protein